jgi:nucleotide-binding universal stress UspA family protein
MSAIQQSEGKSERQLRFCNALNPRKILACVDLGNDADGFVRCVLEFAELHGATVHLLHVVQPDPFMGGMESVPLVLSMDEIREEVSSQLLGMVDRGNLYQVRVWPLVRKGPPEQEISAAAREVEADLIVIPSHPPAHFRRWHHGTAEKVVQQADCPVLVLQ